MSTSPVVDLEEPAPGELLLPAVAARMCESALLFCCRRTVGDSESRVAAALGASDPRSLDCFRNHLSREIAEFLRKLDDNLVGVYSYCYGDAEEEGEDRGFSPTEPLRLILRVRKKTAALNAAVDALDQALLEEYKRLIAPVGDRMTSFLDVHMVDDEESVQGTGLAVVLRSVFVPPTRVWAISR
ncbi:MAG TPA: hypothetical protein VHS28_05470 [Chloroflexota bacterium]|nr:hypothetical protein [Chloroflexota bacterium]